MDELKKWEEVKQKYHFGQKISGFIRSHQDFGLFVNIGEYPILGFIRVVDITDNFVGGHIKDYYPPVGSRVEGRVVELTDHNQQVVITLRNKFD